MRLTRSMEDGSSATFAVRTVPQFVGTTRRQSMNSPSSTRLTSRASPMEKRMCLSPSVKVTGSSESSRMRSISLRPAAGTTNFRVWFAAFSVCQVRRASRKLSTATMVTESSVTSIRQPVWMGRA